MKVAVRVTLAEKTARKHEKREKGGELLCRPGEASTMKLSALSLVGSSSRIFILCVLSVIRIGICSGKTVLRRAGS